MSDNANRVEFTREMKKDYTIITPNMAPIHFELIKNVLESFGYHIDLLRTTGREIADEGLKYVHNDTCYPALLSIGQLMHALHSGKYDPHKGALIPDRRRVPCLQLHPPAAQSPEKGRPGLYPRHLPEPLRAGVQLRV